MANCDYLQTQLTSVLNSLVKIAVVELLRIVEDSAVELRLEVSRSKFENEALKIENESNKNKLKSLEAELWTAGNRPCSICYRRVAIPARGGCDSPRRDRDAAGPLNSSEDDDASWLQRSAPTVEETTAMERDGIQIIVIKNEAGHEGTQQKKDTQAAISTEGEQPCPKVDMVYGKEWSQSLWRDGDAVREDSAGPSVTHRQVKTVSAQKRGSVCVKKSVIEEEPADSSDAGIQHQNTTESHDVKKSFEPESCLNFEENRFLTSPVNIMVPKCVTLPDAAAVMDTQLDKSMDFDNINNSGRKKRGRKTGPCKGNVNYCFVCGEPQSKISRHLKQHEKENAEIAYVLSLDIASRQRKVLLEKLRNKGNFQHNTNVVNKGSGCLKVKRKPKPNSGAKRFEPCLYCKGMFIWQDVRRHMGRCPCRPQDGDQSQEHHYGKKRFSQSCYTGRVSSVFNKIDVQLTPDGGD